MGDDGSLGAFVADPGRTTHEEVFEGLRADHVREALDQLRPAERRILVLRYGLEGHAPHNASDVARLLGVSRERARLMEEEALAILRRLPEGRRLRDAA